MPAALPRARSVDTSHNVADAAVEDVSVSRRVSKSTKIVVSVGTPRDPSSGATSVMRSGVTAWAPEPASAAIAVPATATVRAAMAAPATSAASLLRTRRPLLTQTNLIEASA